MIIPKDLSGIDPKHIPNHVACIMDGNGRWATSRGLPRSEGHRQGEEALAMVVDAALELGVRWLTVFAFSTENWTRPREEVDFLMAMHEALFRRRDEMAAKGVRYRWIGRRTTSPESRAPETVLKEIFEAVEQTKHNSRLNLTIAFDYGGRAELVEAGRQIAALALDGMITDPGAIDELVFAKCLQLPELPDVDLLVRTSGEFRISNFLPWHIAYAEIVVADTLWPDFGKLHLAGAIQEYQHRDIRKGGLGESPGATG